MDKTTIIVVEDNIVYCEFVCNMLAREGYRTVKAYHLSTAKKHLQQATDNDIGVSSENLVNWNYGDDCVMLMLCLRIACIHVLSVKALPEPSLEGSVNCTLLFCPCLMKGNDYG